MMPTHYFIEFLEQVKRGQFPALTGFHFSKEQYDEVFNVLQERRSCEDNWVYHVLNTRVEKKEHRRKLNTDYHGKI